MATSADCALYYQRHRSARLEYQRRYYANPNNKAKRATYMANVRAKLSPEERETISVMKRGASYQRKYGISIADYDSLHAAQKGVCAICQDPARKGSHAGRLDVDHCHATGKVRGLLCRQCNQALGAFGDTAEGVERAWRYIRG